MAKGRARQMRQHAVNQASMVAAMFGEIRSEQLQQFIETGSVDADAGIERIPYDPAILQDLQKRAT